MLCQLRLLSWHLVQEGDLEMELDLEEVYRGVQSVKVKEDEARLNSTL